MANKWTWWMGAVAAAWVALAGGAAWGQVKSLKATAVKGVRFVALKDLAGMYQLELATTGKVSKISGEYVKLEFTGDSRQAAINGTCVWLHQPVTKVKGQWSLCDADAQFVVDPLVRPSAYLGGRGTALVALDAGHGGKDPGALAGNGAQEKALSLDIARRVRAHLAVSGVRVTMTRDKDEFVELADRPKAASKAKADLFVSIHLNATANAGVHGAETYSTAAAGQPPTAGGTGAFATVPNNAFNHSGTVLAYQIQKALTGISRADDRGVKRARFVVLRESTMPAALVECGFLTNAGEAAKLQTPTYREVVARGIAQGILNYLALVKRAKGGGAPGTAVAQVPRAVGTVGGVSAPVVAPAVPVVPVAAPGVAGPATAPVARGPVATAAPRAPTGPGTVAGGAPAVRPLAPTPVPAVGGPVAQGPRPAAVPAALPAVSPGMAGRGVGPTNVAPRPPVAVAPPPGMVLRTSYQSGGPP